MFTGIVDHVGQVVSVTSKPLSKTLFIQSDFKDLKLGESIAIDGTCLTVTSFKKGGFEVDVSSETLKLTTLKECAEKTFVNLERALQVGDRFGGHFVSGHIDSTLVVEKVKTEGDYLEVTFGELDPKHRKYIHTKGSISINGVSLTVNSVATNKNGFTVMLIPHTLERTNLKKLGTGMRVNVEFDLMSKIILERVDQMSLDLNMPIFSSFEKGRSLEDI